MLSEFFGGTPDTYHTAGLERGTATSSSTRPGTTSPILGVDSDNGSEFINITLLQWCTRRKITFTRARPGNKNDGCHVEQKNWAVVRTVVGYHRYDTAPELLLLNEIWQLQSKLTNYFHPQQKLISKVRAGAKVSKKHDKARTRFIARSITQP